MTRLAERVRPLTAKEDCLDAGSCYCARCKRDGEHVDSHVTGCHVGCTPPR